MNAPSQIASALLTDTRPQLFCIDGNNNLWSCWKTTTQAGAPWTEWSQFPLSGPGSCRHIASALLTDVRPQLFCIDGNNNLWSCWKTTVYPPDAPWTEWSRFD